MDDQIERGAVPRILLVEDDEVDCEWISRLVGRDFEVRACSTAAAARDVMDSQAVHCVLMDFGLPDADGGVFISECATRGLPVVVLTGQSGAVQAVQGMKAGAYDYLTKDGLSGEVLRQTLRKGVERHSMQRQLERQKRELDAAYEEILVRERRLSLILESIREGFWIAQGDWSRFLYASPLVETIWDTSLGPTGALSGVMEDDLACLLELRSVSESSYDINYRYQHSSGELVWLRERATRTSQDGVPVWVGVTEDISESKELEGQFFQAQKMDALGRLAGGLAHDFNNILSCIVGYTHLVAESLDSADPAQEDLGQVQAASRRATDLIKQLLTFSRDGDVKGSGCCLSQTTSEVGQLLRRTVGDHISLKVTVPDESLPVDVTRSRLEQILMNLMVNGRDAMPDGGSLLVQVSKQGDKACLIVRDYGCGIPLEHREKIFEPFFTTKNHLGTGLGLSTVFNIVRSHGGEISVRSQVGKGTEFHVLLPLSDKSFEVTEPREGPAVELSPASGTVLLVEDEPSLRVLIRRVMESRGYTVIDASDGMEGLMLGQRNRSHLIALVTDVRMPGMSGREMARQLRSEGGELPTLYISGYLGEEFGDQPLSPDEMLLAKPFSVQGLVDHLESMLARPAIDLAAEGV